MFYFCWWHAEALFVHCVCRPFHSVLTLARHPTYRKLSVHWSFMGKTCTANTLAKYTPTSCVYDCMASAWYQMSESNLGCVCLSKHWTKWKHGLGGSAIICNGNSPTWDAQSFTSYLTEWGTCQTCQQCEQRELISCNVTKHVWKSSLVISEPVVF